MTFQILFKIFKHEEFKLKNKLCINKNSIERNNVSTILLKL